MSVSKENLLSALDSALVSVTWWHRQEGSPWMLRIRRASKFPLKSLVYLFSKLVPFTLSSNMFLGVNMYYKMPEHFYFYFFGFYVNNTTEAGLTKILINSIEEGDTVIDIGANCGLETLLGSVLVGDSGEVHSFEPTPDVFDLLEKSTKGLVNTKVNKTALLDKVGESTFYTDPKYSVANSIEKSSKSQVESRTVTDTLDDYCFSNKVVPTFLKIDAEGSELKILQGGLKVLERCSPTIAMEVLKEVEEVGQRASEILLELGYSAFRIENKGELAEVSIEDLKSDEIYKGEGFVNILFKKV